MWWLLVACAPERCPPETYREDDGRCYGETEGPPTFEQVLAQLPECRPREGNGQLDLATRCAGPVCAADSYSAMQEALGAGSCRGFTYEGHWSIYCYWLTGLSAFFPAVSASGPEQDTPLWDEPAISPLYVRSPYDATTEDGLGSGSQLSCWIEALGQPEVVELAWECSWYVRRLAWPDLGFALSSSDGCDEWSEPGFANPPYTLALGAP